MGILPVRDAETGQMILLDTTDQKMIETIRSGQEQHNQAVKMHF